LLGKKVIIVKNLAPAKLRGVESTGMLLVAEGKDGQIEVIEPVADAGEKITAEGIESTPKKQITIKEFFKVNLEVQDNSILTDGHALFAGKEKIKTNKIRNGTVS